jgi:hypothetical protein
MTERHKRPREAPQHQRPPRGRGWSRRRSDVLGDATVWRLWAPTGDGRIVQTQVTVMDLEIELAGRWTAAMRLREARRALRQALGAARSTT